MTNKYKNGAWKTTTKAQDDFAKIMWGILAPCTMSTNFFNSTGIVVYNFKKWDLATYEFIVNRKGLLVNTDPRTEEQKERDELSKEWLETIKNLDNRGY